MLWTGFSVRISQYFSALSFSSILMSPSVPAAEKQPHSMRLIPESAASGVPSVLRGAMEVCDEWGGAESQWERSEAG